LTALSPEIGLLKISGKDAQSFLQGQVTCNVNDLTPDNSLLGAHCNLKGRMQSLFRLLLDTTVTDYPSYFLLLPHSMISFASQHFKKYAIFSKVTIEEAPADLQLIGLYGPGVKQMIEQVTHDKALVFKLPGHFDRYGLLAPFAVIETIWLKLREQKVTLVSPQAWELLDIRAGLPAVYPSTMDQILPHHANLSILEGISYQKGCYVGQEIIARMQFRGKIKKHMYHGYADNLSAEPIPGDQIYAKASTDNESPGMVVRACKSVGTRYELLLILDDQFAEFKNVHLYSADGPKIHRLELPYTW
jgi:folate-binding protein YgfZ